MYSNANLAIEYTILIQDANDPKNLITWVASGVTNPVTITKSNLVQNPNSWGSSNPFDCHLTSLPGRQKFAIMARVVGDCCNYCPSCVGGGGSFVYYGKSVWSG